jgi:hypothetical protein
MVQFFEQEGTEQFNDLRIQKEMIYGKESG